MRLLLLTTLLVALSGCAGLGSRYQLASVGNTVWRLDTVTGNLEACGFEASKPVCHVFPAPAQK